MSKKRKVKDVQYHCFVRFGCDGWITLGMGTCPCGSILHMGNPTLLSIKEKVMNPNAIVFWGLCSGIGYLANGTHGAIIGLVGALACSFLASLVRR
jgi:hypothetical protein